MASKSSPEWLPAGWTVQLKQNGGRKVEHYYNVETGQKFYSKEDVIRYLKMGSLSNPEPMSQQRKSRKKKNNTQNVDRPADDESLLEADTSEGIETPEWLPTGWTIEVKTRYPGVKFKCYIDARSGHKCYSKPQVLRYLEKVNSGTVTQKKRNGTPEWVPHGWTVEVKSRESGTKYKCYIDPESGHKFYSKQQVCRYLQTPNGSTTGQQDNVDPVTGDKSSSETAVSQKEVPEWLPCGWTMEVKKRDKGVRKGMKYKCYIDPESGHNFFSKPQVDKYLATLNSNAARQETQNVDSATDEKSFAKPNVSQNCKTSNAKHTISKLEEAGIPNNFIKEVIARGPADGLPPGWIKEVGVRKYGKATHRDPYFTDPVSGYIFRSKPDALRYVESGDIGKCAIKPKKRDPNEIKLIMEEIASPDGQKSMNTTTRRQLFAGKDSSDPTSLVAQEGESTKETQDASASPDAIAASVHTNDIPTEKLPLDTVNENCSQTEGSPYPKTKASVFAGGGSVPPPATGTLQQAKLAENGMVMHSKSKNKKSPILPGRFSKRLKGLQPEIKSETVLSERAIRAAARGQFEAESERERDKSEKPVVDNGADQAVQEEEQTERENAEKENGEKTEMEESQFLSDPTFQDPCLDFAFKTLTGAIPVERNLGLDDLFQQSGPSQAQIDDPSKSVTVQQGNVKVN